MYEVKLLKNLCEALQFVEKATCFDASNWLYQQHDEHSMEGMVTTFIGSKDWDHCWET